MMLIVIKGEGCLHPSSFHALLSIALSSCSGAVNTYGKIDKNNVYMSVGEGDNEYKITEGELWKELQWVIVVQR